MVKAQKGSKDIVKIVHVTQWFNRNFTKLQEYFFVRKENKNSDFIQQIFSVSSLAQLMRVPWRRRRRIVE